MSTKFKIPVHVEISIKPNCILSLNEIYTMISEWLKRKYAIFYNCELPLDNQIDRYIDSVKVVDLSIGKKISFWQAELCLHAFRLSEQGPENDFISGEGGNESLPACEQWELPNALLNNLWDSIIIDGTIKHKLLSYCSSSIQFSDARIDTDIISWNRMLLLHGPPGTGKTTICKGLAQKAFIRNSDKFQSGILLEVNSHSLFSKWFSESGKLVMKLFNHISEIADDEECMVVVLIDEVESITASRSSSGRSNEPGDAVRVVNAVLTSLDALKRRPNVLVLCTSNLIDTVDSAFLDRIDLKIYLGAPITNARYSILLSCLNELMKKGIIKPEQVVLSNNCVAVEKQLYSMLINDKQLLDTIKYDNSSTDHTNTSHVSNIFLSSMITNYMDRILIPELAAGLDLITTGDDDDSDVYDDQINGTSHINRSSCNSSDIIHSHNNNNNSHSNNCNQGTSHMFVINDNDDDGDDVNMCYSDNCDSNNEITHHSNTMVASKSRLQFTHTTTTAVAVVVDETTTTAVAAIPLNNLTLKFTPEQYLYILAIHSENLSGRALRKLPIKAHACYLQRNEV